jgi:subtilisin family serine protease
MPTAGIWTIRVYAEEEMLNGRFDMWLPITPFLSDDTYFLEPEPDTTITEPGNADQVLTITAYSGESGGIALDSSRGFTRNGIVKPDLAAPGINVRGPIRGGLYTARSGSSVAAALGAGVAALLMEYDSSYTGVQIKNYLIRGAVRDQRGYPNTEFGWGKMNLYDTLENMRT